MTQEERIELLRQVSAVAPEEMGAVLIQSKKPNAQGVKFSNENGQATGILTLNGDDVFDAEAIIAMLDAIQAKEDKSWVRLGYYPDIAQSPYNVVVYYESPDGLFIRESEGFGATRAEAVARAFVQVFEEKE